MEKSKIINIDQIRRDRSNGVEDLEVTIMLEEASAILAKYEMEIAFSKEELTIIYKAFRQYVVEEYPVVYYDKVFLEFFNAVVLFVRHNGSSMIALDDFIKAMDKYQNYAEYNYLIVMKPLIESEIAKIKEKKEKNKVIAFKPIDDQKK